MGIDNSALPLRSVLLLKIAIETTASAAAPAISAASHRDGLRPGGSGSDP